jgi:ribonuclease-3
MMISSNGINIAARDKLELDQYLLVIHNNVDSHRLSKLMCDTFEALIGGIYYDCGMRKVHAVVCMVFADMLQNNIYIEKYTSDSKTTLQEICHKHKIYTPRYSSTEHGPSHEKYYVTYLRVFDRVFGPKEGRSKKISEKLVALEALEFLKKSNNKSFLNDNQEME